LQAAADTLSLRVQDRLGLRYVNQIVHPAGGRELGDWPQLLSPELIGIGGRALSQWVMNSLQQIELEEAAGRLTIRHGYVRQPEMQPSVYTLDLDAHNDSQGAFRVDEIMTRAETYKGWIWNFFRNSITQDLYNYLEPQPLT
jgi:uncharacterized protein (TIGR04255 family)